MTRPSRFPAKCVRSNAYVEDLNLAGKPIAPARRVRDVKYAVRDVVVLAQQLADQGQRMLYLNIGDPNPCGFRPPEAMLDAVKVAMDANHNGYAPSDGIDAAIAAIAREAERKGVRSPVHTWIGNGASEVIDMALTALVNPGENVLTPSPGYPLYTALLAKLEAQNRPYHLDEDRGWLPDVDDIARQIDEKTRAIVVINPNNPTGSVASESALRAIVDLAAEHDLVVFADEIYDRLLFDGKEHVALGSLRDDATVLTLGGLSKNWVVPGFRIGWGVLGGDADRLADYVEAIQQLGRARLSANHPEQHAIAPALDGDQSHLAAMIDELSARRDLAVDRLNAISGISCVAPQGAFYAFPRIEVEADDQIWCQDLMRETGVVVVPGSGFGQREGTQHFRIVLLPDRDQLSDAFDGIEAFMRRT
ncbi:MAG: aminotransferase [Planctomycetes bacterium]|nr:aminotransferase [Planctomycetota bacterium]